MGRLDDLDRRIRKGVADLDARIGQGIADLDARIGQGIADLNARIGGLETARAPAGGISQAGSSWAVPEDFIDEALACVEVRVRGYKPGAVPRNGAFPESEWREIASLAKKDAIYLGCLDASAVAKEEIYFEEAENLAPERPNASDDYLPLAVKRAILAAAGYYALRWKFKDFHKAESLYSWAELTYGADGQYSLTECSNACRYSLRDEPDPAVARFVFSKDNHSPMCAAHEFTHAVSNGKVGWGSHYSGETGALNESFSDIFAIFANWAWHGRENIAKPWLFDNCRDLAHPENSPECKHGWIKASWYRQPPVKGNPKSGWYRGNEDYGGVHYNNGVVCRLCFLLSDGEDFVRSDGRHFDVRPIGPEKTEALFGRLLFDELMTESETMVRFSKAVLRAANEIGLSSGEVSRVRVACDAVNILNPGTAGRGLSDIAEGRRLEGFEKGFSDDRAVADAIVRTFARELGMDAAGAGARVVKADNATSSRGLERRLVLAQDCHGVPVFGASVIAFVDRDGTMSYLHGAFSKSLDRVAMNDSIGSGGAVRIVGKVDGGDIVGIPEKVVYDPGVFDLEGEPALAWRVVTGSGAGALSNQYLVNAATGEILLTSPLHTT